MGFDYEEENALEWQEPEVREEYRRLKEAEKAEASKKQQASRVITPGTNNNGHGRGRGRDAGPAPAPPGQPMAVAKQVNQLASTGPSYASAAGGGQIYERSGNMVKPRGPLNPVADTTNGPSQQQFASMRQVPPSLSAHQIHGQLTQHTSASRASRPPPQAGPNRPVGVFGAGSRSLDPQQSRMGQGPRPHERVFAKVRPENDNYGKEAERRRKEDERNKHFIGRQTGDGVDDIGYRGVFILNDQMTAKPDPIKKSLNDLQGRRLAVEILLDRQVVELVAPEAQTIQLALSRTRGVVLGSINAQEQFQMILVDSPGDGMMLKDTKLHMMSAWDKEARPQAAGLSLPRNKSKMFPVLMPVPRNHCDPAEEQRRLRRNTLAVQVATTRALGRLTWFKGSVIMRIHFGALAFHRYRWQQAQTEQATETFLENLTNSGTEAGLYKLARQSELFTRLMAASHLLAPFRDGPVEATRPSFTGHFIWMKGDKADRIFEVQTEAIGSDHQETPAVLRRGWMPPHAPGLTKPLSIFLTQLNSGISCALQVHTEETFVQPKDTPASLTARVTSPIPCKDYVVAAQRGELLFDWMSSGCLDFRQRTTWKYRLKTDEAYILELVRYDGYERNLSVLSKQPTETRWDACVYHEKWQEKFAENIRIRHGEKATWDPSVENFFPAEDSEAEGEPGVPPGLAVVMQWIRDFLDAVNAEERQKVWRN